LIQSASYLVCLGKRERKKDREKKERKKKEVREKKEKEKEKSVRKKREKKKKENSDLSRLNLVVEFGLESVSCTVQ
jgi:mannitol-specific phosphotransferase system IIBC component